MAILKLTNINFTNKKSPTSIYDVIIDRIVVSKSMKTNQKITILEILLHKIEPEIIKSKIFSVWTLLQSHVHMNEKAMFLWTWFCNRVEMLKDFWFCYFCLYFVYQNFQTGFFQISLHTILFEVICWKWIIVVSNKIPFGKKGF